MLPLLLLMVQSAFPSEIKVSLFGQPCQLTGPVSEAILNSIHAISPEKISTPETADQARRDLAALRAIGGLPTEFDRYRDLLTKRLESYQIFHEAIATARRAGKPDSLFSAVKPLLEARKFKTFQAAVRKAVPKTGTAAWTPGAMEQVRDEFERLSPPDPQEEFQRGIRRLKVFYNCTFEEGEHAEDDEEAEPADQAPPSPGPSPTR